MTGFEAAFLYFAGVTGALGLLASLVMLADARFWVALTAALVVALGGVLVVAYARRSCGGSRRAREPG